MVHAAGPLRAGAADRRPHRLGPERRLARRRAERRRGRRGAAAARRGGRAGRDRSPRQLGRRGGRALRPLAVRLERRRRVDGRPGRAARRARTPTAALPDVLAEHGVDLDRARARRSSGTRPPTSSCTSSRARCSRRWTCRSASSSAPSASSATRSRSAARPRTPARRRWTQRRDALAGAAKLELEIREIAKRTGGGAVCTMGCVVTKPGIVTSVVETAECLLDQRHLDAATLARCSPTRRPRPSGSREEEDIEVEWERIWQIEPILFDDALIELADEASGRSPARRTACRAGRCTTRPRSRARACRR